MIDWPQLIIVVLSATLLVTGARGWLRQERERQGLGAMSAARSVHDMHGEQSISLSIHRIGDYYLIDAMIHHMTKPNVQARQVVPPGAILTDHIAAIIAELRLK
jgi:hypothetical protein